MIDKEVMNFEIDLAQIGMRFGAFFALGVAILAIGATLLFTSHEHLFPVEAQVIIGIGMFFFLFGFVLAIWSNIYRKQNIDRLKKN